MLGRHTIRKCIFEINILYLKCSIQYSTWMEVEAVGTDGELIAKTHSQRKLLNSKAEFNEIITIQSDLFYQTQTQQYSDKWINLVVNSISDSKNKPKQIGKLAINLSLAIMNKGDYQPKQFPLESSSKNMFLSLSVQCKKCQKIIRSSPLRKDDLLQQNSASIIEPIMSFKKQKNQVQMILREEESDKLNQTDIKKSIPEENISLAAISSFHEASDSQQQQILDFPFREVLSNVTSSEASPEINQLYELTKTQEKLDEFTLRLIQKESKIRELGEELKKYEMLEQHYNELIANQNRKDNEIFELTQAVEKYMILLKQNHEHNKDRLNNSNKADFSLQKQKLLQELQDEQLINSQLKLQQLSYLKQISMLKLQNDQLLQKEINLKLQIVKNEEARSLATKNSMQRQKKLKDQLQLKLENQKTYHKDLHLLRTINQELQVQLTILEEKYQTLYQKYSKIKNYQKEKVVQKIQLRAQSQNIREEELKHLSQKEHQMTSEMKRIEEEIDLAYDLLEEKEQMQKLLKDEIHSKDKELQIQIQISKERLQLLQIQKQKVSTLEKEISLNYSNPHQFGEGDFKDTHETNKQIMSILTANTLKLIEFERAKKQLEKCSQEMEQLQKKLESTEIEKKQYKQRINQLMRENKKLIEGNNKLGKEINNHLKNIHKIQEINHQLKAINLLLEEKTHDLEFKISRLEKQNPSSKISLLVNSDLIEQKSLTNQAASSQYPGDISSILKQLQQLLQFRNNMISMSPFFNKMHSSIENVSTRNELQTKFVQKLREIKLNLQKMKSQMLKTQIKEIRRRGELLDLISVEVGVNEMQVLFERLLRQRQIHDRLTQKSDKISSKE